jgi:hypothetical protein
VRHPSVADDLRAAERAETAALARVSLLARVSELLEPGVAPSAAEASGPPRAKPGRSAVASDHVVAHRAASWQVVALAALLGAALLTPAPAPGATLTPLAQERFVRLTDVRAGADIERIDATDFGAFDAAAGEDEATQQSTLAGDRIQATVTHDVLAEASPAPHLPSEHFEAESSFSLTFELDAASPFQLSVDVTRLDPTGNIALFPVTNEYSVVLEANLSGPGGTLFAFHWDDAVDCPTGDGCDLDLGFVEEGTLDPGTYTLTARSFADVSGGFTASLYPISLHSDGVVGVDLMLPEPTTPMLLAAGLAALGCLSGRGTPARAPRPGRPSSPGSPRSRTPATG